MEWTQQKKITFEFYLCCNREYRSVHVVLCSLADSFLSSPISPNHFSCFSFQEKDPKFWFKWMFRPQAQTEFTFVVINSIVVVIAVACRRRRCRLRLMVTYGTLIFIHIYLWYCMEALTRVVYLQIFSMWKKLLLSRKMSSPAGSIEWLRKKNTHKQHESIESNK